MVLDLGPSDLLRRGKRLQLLKKSSKSLSCGGGSLTPVSEVGYAVCKHDVHSGDCFSDDKKA